MKRNVTIIEKKQDRDGDGESSVSISQMHSASCSERMLVEVSVTHSPQEEVETVVC